MGRHRRQLGEFYEPSFALSNDGLTKTIPTPEVNADYGQHRQVPHWFEVRQSLLLTGFQVFSPRLSVRLVSDTEDKGK